ncbi:MAG: hypothetical protein ACJ789_19685 [Thermomicrobiales bacterium]
MKRWLFVLLLVLAMSSFFATPQTGAQADASLKVAQDPAVGAFLTDGKGMTLYLFTKDTEKGKSVCSGECATAWPVSADDTTKLPAGGPGKSGSIDRDDGSKQATYNDIPLNYFAKDAKAGDIAGQEVGGVWFVIPPSAKHHTKYPAAPGEGTPFPATSVKIGFTGELGPFLTDAKGMTVYLFTKDTEAGKSACSGDCAASWPAVPAETELLLPPGISGKLTSFKRDDGSMQLAYNDLPLYYFAKDTKAGDTNGQEVGDVWYIVPPGMKLGDKPHEATAEGTPDSGY